MRWCVRAASARNRSSMLSTTTRSDRPPGCRCGRAQRRAVPESGALQGLHANQTYPRDWTSDGCSARSSDVTSPVSIHAPSGSGASPREHAPRMLTRLAWSSSRHFVPVRDGLRRVGLMRRHTVYGTDPDATLARRQRMQKIPAGTWIMVADDGEACLFHNVAAAPRCH